MGRIDGWGYRTSTHIAPDKVKWQRTGTPVVGIPFIAAEWDDEGKSYILLATYQKEPDAVYAENTLTIQQWDPLRQRWEEQPIPHYLRLALILWGDVVLHLPVHL